MCILLCGSVTFGMTALKLRCMCTHSPSRNFYGPCLCVLSNNECTRARTHTLLSLPPQIPMTDFISEPDKKVKSKLYIQHWRKKHKEKGTAGLPDIFIGLPPSCLKNFHSFLIPVLLTLYINLYLQGLP